MTDKSPKRPMRPERPKTPKAYLVDPDLLDEEAPVPPPPPARTLNRRQVIAGAATAGAAVVAGLVVADSLGGGTNAAKATTSPTATSAPTSAPSIAQAVESPVAAVASPPAAGLPDGMALVTSTRLPLRGISADHVQALLQGAATNWRDVGGPITLPVMPYAIDGVVAAGMKSPKTVDDYAALVTELNKTPGAFAMVPLSEIDFQVNTLAIGGVDPLKSATGGDDIISIAVVGDIIPGRNVAIHCREYGDWTHPFLQVKDFLSGFDVTIGNFECVISDTIAPPEESNANTFEFIASSDVIEGLTLCGIDAITLANNHTAWNESGWGIEPFVDMLGILDDHKFPYFGGGNDLDEAQRGWTKTIGNTSIVFIGVDAVTANIDYDGQPGTVGKDIGSGYAGAGASTPGTNPLDVKSVNAKITDLAGQYDIVIPYIHMGQEYEWITPSWCTTVAHGFIDAGATMVISNHPHLIQGMEVYKGVPIVYSVGNFVFDQMFSVDVRTGYVLDLVFQGKKLVGLRQHGYEIEDFNQPRLMSTGEHAALMDRFWRSTDLRARQASGG